MLNSNSESTVFDMFSAVKAPQSQEFYDTWKSLYKNSNKKEPPVKSIETTSTLIGYEEAYKNSKNPKYLTEEEFCNIMMKQDSSNDKVYKEEQPYTTIFGQNKKQVSDEKDTKQPPVTSIIPDEEILKNATQINNFNSLTQMTCDADKFREPFKLEVDGFDKHKIRFNDLSQIPYTTDFIKPTADTLDDEKWYNPINTDTTNGINVFNDDETKQCCLYSSYEIIGPFYSKTDLMDYVMDHIDKFDNNMLDQLIYRISKEKVHRIDNEDNTEK